MRKDPKPRLAIDRFLSKIQKTEGCWLWLGKQHPKGYYCFWETPSKMIMAHRAAWQFFYGEIKPGFMVVRSCRELRCVNPEHLSLSKTKGFVYAKQGTKQSTSEILFSDEFGG